MFLKDILLEKLDSSPCDYVWGLLQIPKVI